MKKIFAFLSCILFATNVWSAPMLNPDAAVLELLIPKYFTTQEQQTNALSLYKEKLSANSGNGLSASDVSAVCVAGGASQSTCTAFINELHRYSTFYPICQSTSGVPNGAKTVCEKKFFNDTEVQMISGIQLAKEYAKLKLNDEIICSGKRRNDGLQDYLQCRSVKNNTFYEFEFDDLTESVDYDIQEAIANAICRMFDKKPNGFLCPSAADGCPQMNTVAKTFGGSVTHMASAGCRFKFESIQSKDGLKTACNIDNFTYCRGIQVQSNLTIQDYLKQQTATKCGVDVSQIKCDSSFKTYRGAGCAVSSFAPKDDIISCYYNGQQIDYVFDDANEAYTYVAKAGQQGMQCITSDGIFDGKNCSLIGKDLCDQLAAANKIDCPDCKDIRWDAEHSMCILPNAKIATNVDKGVKIGTVAGVAILAVAPIVFSGGTAAPGAWAIVAKTADILLVSGALGKITSESVMTFGIFEPFVEKANQCFNSGETQCVEDLLIDELNRMQSYSINMTDTEADALDKIFVKLINELPDDSKFWTDFYGNPKFFDCPVPSDLRTCVVKESAQLWQVVNTVSNAAMVAGGFMKMLATIGSRLAMTQQATRARVVGNMNSKSPLLKVVNPGGSNGSLVENAFIADKMNISGVTTNSGLVKHLGLKVGDVIWLTDSGKVVTNVSMVKNLWGLIPVTVGTGGLLYHSNDDADFFVTRGGGNDVQPEPTPVPVPEPQPTPEPAPVEPEPAPEPQPAPGPQPNPGPQPEPGPQPQPVNPTPTPVPTPTPAPVPVEPIVTVIPVTPVVTPVVTPIDTPVTPYQVDKKPNTALIATASVLGAVGVGGLIGGLVGMDKDDDNANANANNNAVIPVVPVVPTPQDKQESASSINTVAAGVIGYVGNDALTLVPMPTAQNTTSHIVNIQNSAVVVVNWRGHYLPYYVNASVAKWTPVLGIGENGGWFNAYPTAKIAQVENIATILAQKLAVNNVKQQINAFPAPRSDAYQIINKEFPNGVIQTYTGTFTPQQQQLYNNNYNIVKNLF